MFGNFFGRESPIVISQGFDIYDRKEVCGTTFCCFVQLCLSGTEHWFQVNLQRNLLKDINCFPFKNNVWV